MFLHLTCCVQLPGILESSIGAVQSKILKKLCRWIYGKPWSKKRAHAKGYPSTWCAPDPPRPWQNAFRSRKKLHKTSRIIGLCYGNNGSIQNQEPRIKCLYRIHSWQQWLYQESKVFVISIYGNNSSAHIQESRFEVILKVHLWQQ